MEKAPPQVSGSVRGVRRQRYVAGSALANVSIAAQNLSCALSMALDSTNGRSVWSAARVLAVEVWGPPGTTTPVTVTVEWEGASNYSVSTSVSDTSIGATVPAHVRTSPPKSLVDIWLDAGNTSVLFYVSGPAGTIIDVTFEWVADMATSGAAVTAFNITGGTAGRCFCRALDGAGGLLPPVGCLNYAG